MNNEDAQGVKWFFMALRDFWNKERVDQWRNAVYGDAAKTEKVQNLITLAHTAHQLHTKALFALEHVDRDKVHGKSLKLRFWWLKKHDHQDGVEFGVRPQLPGDFSPKEYAVGLHNVSTDYPLVSGDVITFETHNPETHPLPDTRLLDIQWMLQRVLAIRGGAEPEDPDDDESDEGSDGGLDWFKTRMSPSPILPGKSSPPSSVKLDSDPP